MIFGQAFGLVSLGTQSILTDTIGGIDWVELCPPTVNVVTREEFDNPDFVQVAVNLWVQEPVSPTGAEIRRC